MSRIIDVNKNGRLQEVALLFLKLGLLAFGGPAAHIAMMEEEVVTKRKWMSRQHFLDLVGATNLIPGPNSTEMTMHCGQERAGWKGLFVAGICFIFPAVLITGILAYFYVKYGNFPAVAPFLYGIKPAVLAIILSAIFKLGRKALKTWQLGVIGSLTLIASLSGVNEIYAILASGLLGMLWLGLVRDRRDRTVSDGAWLPWMLGAGASTLGVSVTPVKFFLVFLKVGAVLFGSGYVLVAYLDAELVEKLGWLSKSELLDAIAIGQFTPGPVLSTATFVGYQIDGWQGAVLATLGIFLPSFFFVLLLNPLVPRLRRSKLAASFLDAVNIGAVAVMLGVTFRLAEEIMVDWRAWLIALLAIAVVFVLKKTNPLYLILGGAILGYGLGFL